MQTRNSILKTAFFLFLEKGFSEVSVNDIIGAAHIAKGGFYYYFKSKDALIEEVIHKFICPFFKEPVEKMKQELIVDENCSMDAKKKLELYFLNVHSIFPTEQMKDICGEIDLRNFYFLVFEGMKKYHCLSDMRKDIYKEKIEIFEKILEEGKKEGVIEASIDCHEWATTINSVKDGMIALHLLDETVDINKKCQISFEHILNEIKT